MRAYEIFLNGKRLCVAGVASGGYVSAYITHQSEPNATWIDVVGLDSRKKSYIRWTQKDLGSGDEVSIKIVDRKRVDKAKVIRRHNEKRDMESLKRGIKEQAKALGFEIRAKRKPK